MNFLQPYLWYLISALIMCILYFGLEQANGGLGFTAKSVLCTWCIASTLITVALFGIQSAVESGATPPPQATALTFGASVITLCISSGCLYCAK